VPKFETNIPRNETARHHSNTHTCICERFIYSQDQSSYFAAFSWDYINRSQIRECRNWERGREVSFLEIHKVLSPPPLHICSFFLPQSVCPVSTFLTSLLVFLFSVESMQRLPIPGLRDRDDRAKRRHQKYNPTASCIVGHRHRGRCHRQLPSGVRHLGRVLEHSGTRLVPASAYFTFQYQTDQMPGSLALRY
jgi:hypothetical protein